MVREPPAFQAGPHANQYFVAEHRGRLVHTAGKTGTASGALQLRFRTESGIRQFIEAQNHLTAHPFRWIKTAESTISSVNKARLGMIKNRLLN